MLITLLLSLIQGITEFLPVSSTGHLVLAEHFLPGIEPSLFLDAVLHLGTLLAVLIYFRRRWITYLTNQRLLLNLVICTVPAVIFGFLGESFVENTLRGPAVVAAALIIGAIILQIGNRSYTTNRTNLVALTPRQALLIGLFQALALIPGMSRAGMTIAGGLLIGLNRQNAAEFSFLAAVPVIAGAVSLETYQAITSSITINWPRTLIGLTFAFIFGLISISWLIKFLAQKDFKVFVWYRIALGIIILAVTLL